MSRNSHNLICVLYMFPMASRKTPHVVNANLLKKWVYFVYYDVLVFVYIFMMVANRLRIPTLAEGRM